MYCNNCGNEIINPNAKFCDVCGSPVNSKSEVVALVNEPIENKTFVEEPIINGKNTTFKEISNNTLAIMLGITFVGVVIAIIICVKGNTFVGVGIGILLYAIALYVGIKYQKDTYDKLTDAQKKKYDADKKKANSLKISSNGKSVVSSNTKSCPKCNSNAIQFQTVTESRKTGCGTILLYIILAISILGWLILIPLLLRKKNETVTYAVCQNCGHKWRID